MHGFDSRGDSSNARNDVRRSCRLSERTAWISSRLRSRINDRCLSCVPGATDGEAPSNPILPARSVARGRRRIAPGSIFLSNSRRWCADRGDKGPPLRQLPACDLRREMVTQLLCRHVWPGSADHAGQRPLPHFSSATRPGWLRWARPGSYGLPPPTDCRSAARLLIGWWPSPVTRCPPRRRGSPSGCHHRFDAALRA
jgi:hypothetical protein